MRATLVFVASLAASAVAGCSHPVPNATPEGAVRALAGAHGGFGQRPGRGQGSLRLARAAGPAVNLGVRAVRASQVEGRHAQAFEMLAEGRFGLKFRPKAMHAALNGDDAVVDVTGDDPVSEHARVACVREADGWHVEPQLPEVTAPQCRRDGG